MLPKAKSQKQWKSDNVQGIFPLLTITKQYQPEQ
jgi:hypothetical protein